MHKLNEHPLTDCSIESRVQYSFRGWDSYIVDTHFQHRFAYHAAQPRAELLSMDASRVKRLLSSRVDSASLAQALDFYSRLQQSSGDGQQAPEISVEQGSLLLIEDFIRELRPMITTLSGVVDGVDRLSTAVDAAERHVNASTAAAEEFVASAAHMQQSTVALRKELQIAKELTAQFRIRDEWIDLFNQPLHRDAADMDEVFTALDGLAALRASINSRISSMPPDEAGSGAQTILLEQLDACAQLEASALDNLFDWSLNACSNVDDSGGSGSSSGASGSADGGVQSTREPVLQALRKAMAIFARQRPSYLASCQRAFVHSRRGAFLRRFLTTMTSIAGAGGGDPESQLSEILAIVHGNIAEENVYLSAVFPQIPSKSAQNVDATAVGDDNDGAAEVQSPSRLVADISAGIATPVSIRLGAVFDDNQSIASVLRCLDIILFYKDKLSKLVNPSASLIGAIDSSIQRGNGRCEAVLAILVERIRSFPPSLPTKLVPAPLTVDVCLELEQMLQASVGQLSEKLSQHIDASRYVSSIVEQVLGYCRASGEGMDLVSTSIWMLNNTSHVQSTLSPHQYTAETVQMLVGEMAAWEDSVTAQVGNDILRETGLLGKLTAMRAFQSQVHAPDASSALVSSSMASVAGLDPEQILVTLTSFIRAVSSPTLLSVLDLITHAKVRGRTKRDVSQLLISAYSKVRETIQDPRSGYTGNQDVMNTLQAMPADLSVVLGL